jgi:hypothetical protein
MTYQVLNPTSEVSPETLTTAPRLQSLTGATVGVISNGKEGTKGFFAHLERILVDQLQVARVVLRRKSNYSAPAERSIVEEAAGWDVAITGIGD